MKITVTGASSFIGKKLIEKAVINGHECIAVVRRGKRASVQNLIGFEKTRIVEMDMHEYDNLYREAGDTDCLINLAWQGTRGIDRQNHEMQEESYKNTMKAIESMSLGRPKIIVTAGSQAEYGSSFDIIHESCQALPDTEYGKYKLKLYHAVSDFGKKRAVKIIEPRFFSLYGPGDTDKTMIVSMVKKMLRSEVCNLTESVQLWDFLYIDDAVDALMALIEKNAEGGIYNFASGDCRMLKEFIEEMKAVLQSESVLNYGAVKYPDTGMVSLHPDVTKLKRTAGWSPTVSFSEGIKMIRETL